MSTEEVLREMLVTYEQEALDAAIAFHGATAPLYGPRSAAEAKANEMRNVVARVVAAGLPPAVAFASNLSPFDFEMEADFNERMAANA